MLMDALARIEVLEEAAFRVSEAIESLVGSGYIDITANLAANLEEISAAKREAENEADVEAQEEERYARRAYEEAV